MHQFLQSMENVKPRLPDSPSLLPAKYEQAAVIAQFEKILLQETP
jgi:hypothetical protein